MSSQTRQKESSFFKQVCRRSGRGEKCEGVGGWSGGKREKWREWSKKEEWREGGEVRRRVECKEEGEECGVGWRRVEMRVEKEG